METMTKRAIKYVAHGARWFDKVNGNTYHSVRVTRCSDGKVLVGEFQYGYGDQYRYTALELMAKAGWLPDNKNAYLFERQNGYPIEWTVSDGLKRDCIANGR